MALLSPQRGQPMLRRICLLLAACAALAAPNPAAAQGDSPWCGPHLFTYWRAESRVGDAVMCVRIVDRASFAFYSEGWDDARPFRRIGYASRAAVAGFNHRESVFTVRWATLTGNGEAVEEFSTGPAMGTVGVYDWDENRPPPHLVWIDSRPAVWRLWDRGRGPEPAMPRLASIKTCGPRLRAFDVYVEGKITAGIRCALNDEGRPLAVWVGSGAWNGRSYLHLGTAFFGITGARYGASDVCRPGYFCGRSAFGDLRFEGQGDGYAVAGAWTEDWRPVRR
jgi:hypothetical protein